MKKKTVVALIGRARSGKDTVADYIADQLGCNKHALATPLKELVCAMFEIDMETLDKYKNEQYSLKAQKLDRESYNIFEYPIDVSFRHILQRCGDAQKAFFGLDVYMQKLALKMQDEDTVVVSDVRLVEEQRWLIDNTNVTFIKLHRNAEIGRDSAHRTESETDKLYHDYEIVNDGTIDELYAKIDIILNSPTN